MGQFTREVIVQARLSNDPWGNHGNCLQHNAVGDHDRLTIVMMEATPEPWYCFKHRFTMKLYSFYYLGFKLACH